MKFIGLFIVTILLAVGVISQADAPIAQQTHHASAIADALAPLRPIEAAESCDLTVLPQRVGLQVGHWQNHELPDELAKLRQNHGAVVGDLMEWQVMYPIAEQAKALLEAQGIQVDLLPATVPADYCAHAFVSLHADAGTSTRTGYKAAGSAWDESGRSDQLARSLEAAYAAATQLPYEPTVTVNMIRYYSFNTGRFQHAVHSQTPSALLETGFLTHDGDRQFLVERPEVAAQGVAAGILDFLRSI